MKSPQYLNVENLAFRNRRSVSDNAIVIDVDNVNDTKRTPEALVVEKGQDKNLPQSTSNDDGSNLKKHESTKQIKQLIWHQRHENLRTNIFLAVCVLLMVVFSVLFSVFSVPVDPYEYSLTYYATVWPLKNKVVMTQNSGARLTVFWGDTAPGLVQVPDYCNNRTTRWCYYWPEIAILQMTVVQPVPGIDCVLFDWFKSKKESLVEFVNRFSVDPESSAYWYGGLVGVNMGWPIKEGALTMDEGYASLATADAQSGYRLYGVQEPFWVLNTGFALFVDRLYSVEVNQTDLTVSVRSANPYIDELRYAVCRGPSPQSLIMQMQTIRRGIFDVPYDRDDHTVTMNDSEQHPDMFSMVDLDCRNLNNINVTQILQTLSHYNLSFIVVFENFDFFDSQMSVQLTTLLNDTELASLYPTAVEANNYVRTYYVNDDLAEWLRICVLQEAGPHALGNPNPIGTVMWRGVLYFVVDFTRTETRQLFFRAVKSHPIQNYVQYFAFAGGTAAQLPIRSLLNVSTDNRNFYSYEYAMSIGGLVNSLSISTGYGNQNLTNLNIDVPVCPANVSSIIPVFLTLNIFGYSNLVLHYFQPEAVGDTPTKVDLTKMIRWFEIAMYLPKFRVPYKIMELELFKTVYEDHELVRNRTILPHYLNADIQWRQTGVPILRPMWWPNNDPAAWLIDNQFMIGDDLVVAALLLSRMMPEVYLPQGIWHEPNKPNICYNGSSVTVVLSRVDITCFERVKDTSVCN